MMELLSQLDLERLGTGRRRCAFAAGAAGVLAGRHGKGLPLGRCVHSSGAGSVADLAARPAPGEGPYSCWHRGTAADVQAALDILDALHEIAQRSFSVRCQIEILALRALALETQGQGCACCAPRCSRRWNSRGPAASSGFSSIWDRPCRPCCCGLAGKVPSADFAAETVRRILAAFPEPRKKTDGRSCRIRRISVAANAGLLEPLTGRELDVLALLRERLSNKEIAHSLGLSTGDRETPHCQPLWQARRQQALGRRDQGRSPRNPSSALTLFSSSWSTAYTLIYTLRW